MKSNMDIDESDAHWNQMKKQSKSLPFTNQRIGISHYIHSILLGNKEVLPKRGSAGEHETFYVA